MANYLLTFECVCHGVHPALKSFAIVLYAYCGVSMGKIARLYKISTVAVLKWVRAAALDVAPQLNLCL